MRTFLKKNKIGVIIIVILVFIAIPYLVKLIAPYDETNDWAGFWGSYIGTIVSAGIAIFVLIETLDDNRRIQTRQEIVDFCKYITEKTSIFAQKYEQVLYEAHTYLVVNESDNGSAEHKFKMYKECIATIHTAKAVLYEMKMYLEIRRDIVIFHTATLEEMLSAADKAYDYLMEYEKEVNTASRASDVDEKRLYNAIENFLAMIKQYEKQLLDKTICGGDKQMKTIEEIHNETVRAVGKKQREKLAECYMIKLKAEVGDSTAKLLTYKEACGKKLDLNIPALWIATLALILSVLPSMCSLFLLEATPLVKYIVEVGLCAFILVVAVVFYQIVYRARKKYYLMMMVLEKIEEEMKKTD